MHETPAESHCLHISQRLPQQRLRRQAPDAHCSSEVQLWVSAFVQPSVVPGMADAPLQPPAPALARAPPSSASIIIESRVILPGCPASRPSEGCVAGSKGPSGFPAALTQLVDCASDALPSTPAALELTFGKTQAPTGSATIAQYATRQRTNRHMQEPPTHHMRRRLPSSASWISAFCRRLR